ncbi:MAG TPA: 2OG-Fe(II) oxygenase [Trichocoleus sp.]|jgi:Rps23 Pro-64 3,4-dihydroxylase Tpa1-like proline 4-hydroxylase
MSFIMNCLDPNRLENLAQQYQEAYAQADPFPHIVIDNFLSEAVLDAILTEFPDPQSIDWQKFEAAAERKLATKSELQMGESTRTLLYQLNSSTFISFLEQLTGIQGLIPDPHFVGGGLHQIEPGGYLKMHVDFNRHERLNLDRRLNLLIYLNKDWEESYGGHLELWDQEVTQCSKKILPIFNRCVIFSTTDFSYHGHPEPLTCPTGRTRKSLALYYYSNGRPAHETRAVPHSTVFRARPGEELEIKKEKMSVKQLVKSMIPGISKK